MISIILSTFNRAHFIIEMLNSVQHQTYSNFECLIIDDGSTDNTSDVVTNFIKNDNRFSYHARPNSYKKGLPGVRNYGLDICKGEYIIFCDDDDIVHPKLLEISLQYLNSEKVDFCHFQKLAFQEKKPLIEKIEVLNKQEFTTKDLEKIITQQIGLASCTVLWDKECFKTNRFNEDLMYAEEWECYTRILSEGFKGIIVDATLYFNRKHLNSNTGEFYNNNPIRKFSKKEAILLIVKNLYDKKLLTEKLLKYFIQLALDFKEFELFSKILKELNLSFLQRIKWCLFYKFLPLRLYLYGFKKKIIS